MPLIQVESYVAELREALVGLDEPILSASKLLGGVKSYGNRVLCLGNGGSLAVAQHFAQDLLKMCDVRAWTISCPSVITAYSNDNGFEYSYFSPAEKLLDEDDIIFIFSCSGKSRNYIEFVSGFPSIRNQIISVVGTDGGFLKEKSSLSIHIASSDYQVCETAFSIVADILVKSLLEE